MTHIPGHVTIPSNSFGVLFPKLSESSNYFKETTIKVGADEYSIDKGVVKFPILFVLSDADKAKLEIAKNKKKEVGFHAYLLPWEEGDKEFYVMGSDIAIWSDHKSSEDELKKKIKGSKYHKNKNAPVPDIENYFNDFDDIFLDMVDNKFNDRQQQVLKKTRKYMKTSSFKTVYLEDGAVRTSDQVIEWIVKNTIPMKKTGLILVDDPHSPPDQTLHFNH